MFNSLEHPLDPVQSSAPRSSLAESVSVTAVGHPFRTQRMMAELPAGGSIADMMRALGFDPAIPARIFVDDRIVVAGERERIHPKPGQILTVRAIPQGGGNSKDAETLEIVTLPPHPKRNSRFLYHVKGKPRGSPPSPGRFLRTYLGRLSIGGIEASFEYPAFRIPAVLGGDLLPRSFLGPKPIGGMPDHRRFQAPRIRLEETDRLNSKWIAKETDGHLRRWHRICAENRLRSGRPLLASGQLLSSSLARIQRSPRTATLSICACKTRCLINYYHQRKTA